MNFIRTVTMASGSPILTALKRTEDVAAGLFVYGSGVPVEAKVLSIDSHTQVTLSKAATISQAVAVEFTNASNGVYHERIGAQRDAKSVVDEYGDLIEFGVRDEGDVTRDAYASVSKRARSGVYFFRAFPIEWGPNQRKLEKAGIREACDVLIYTAAKDWADYGIDFRDIEGATRSTVKIQGNTFAVKSKALVDQFNDGFLHITFGLEKR